MIPSTVELLAELQHAAIMGGIGAGILAIWAIGLLILVSRD